MSTDDKYTKDDLKSNPFAENTVHYCDLFNYSTTNDLLPFTYWKPSSEM